MKLINDEGELNLGCQILALPIMLMTWIFYSEHLINATFVLIVFFSLLSCSNDLYKWFKNEFNEEEKIHKTKIERIINILLNIGKWNLLFCLSINAYKLYSNGMLTMDMLYNLLKS